MVKKLVSVAVVALAFAAGVAADRFLSPCRTSAVAAVKAEDEAGDEDASDGVTVEEEPEGEFVEAVPADEVRDESEDESGEAEVEEVRDEDGLTDDELREKFKRENPEEWERIQKRRKAMLDEMKKALANRKDFLAAVSDELLSEDQRKVHAAYRTALTVREEARERIRKATASGGEAEAEDYRLMNQADRTVRENAQAEHAALREALGRSLGISDAELPTFIETLKSIDDSVERR